MHVGLWAQPDFFNFDFGLRFACLAFFFIDFENIFPQVKDLYNGRIRVCGDFDQVEIGVSGDLPGFLYGYDTPVFPFGVN